MRKTFYFALFMIVALTTPTAVKGETINLYPVADTKISIDGALSDPTANYGGAETMDVGSGFDGACLAFIAFDTSNLGEMNITDMIFNVEIYVYGDETRTLAVYVYLGIDWDEMSATGLINPFNATGIYSVYPPKGNLTTLTVTPDTDRLTFGLGEYKDYRGILTIGLTTGPADKSWISVKSKENTYSDGAVLHISYESGETTESQGETSETNNAYVGAFAILITVIGVSFAAGYIVAWYKYRPVEDEPEFAF